MKGDKIMVILNDGNGPFTIEAPTNGSAVEWSEDRKWVTVTALSKSQKAVQTMKFKVDAVTSVCEYPAKPV